MRTKARTRRATRGLTLLELLVASVLLAFVMSGGYKALAAFSGAATRQVQKNDARGEVETVMKDVVKAWRLRVGDESISHALVDSPAFAGSDCKGLVITQRDVATGGTKITEYLTVCGGGALTASASSKLHPEVACDETSHPEVTVSRNGRPSARYPAQGGGRAMAICFRLHGDDISVEAGSIVMNGSQAAVVPKRAILTKLDRSEGVEFFQR